MRSFDELQAGDTIELGSVTVSREEIVEFARRYDPQPFHLDGEAAEPLYGGLIASGWHTCALFMRQLVDGFLNHLPSLGSPGLEELRWLRPVRPDDRLTARLTLLEARPSASRPERGILRSRGELVNQSGEVVMTMVATNFFGRQPG